MVNLTSARMFNVTEARAKLNGLVGEAQQGQITHIVSGGQVVAHLVPASTRILDDQAALDIMLAAVIQQEVSWAMDDPMHWSKGRLDHVGDVLGRVLGWCWRTDPDLYMRTVTNYVAKLAVAAGREFTLEDLRLALSRGIGGGAMGDGEIATALAYADAHWSQWALPYP